MIKYKTILLLIFHICSIKTLFLKEQKKFKETESILFIKFIQKIFKVKTDGNYLSLKIKIWNLWSEQITKSFLYLIKKMHFFSHKTFEKEKLKQKLN